MSSKDIAVETLTIVVVSPAQGSVSISSSASQKVKVDGQGVYSGPLQFSVSNVVQPPDGTATPGSVGSGSIQPTAQRTKAEGQAVIRVGDRVDGLVAADAMRPGSSGSPEPSPITFSVEIQAAGQGKVKGE